MQPLLGRSENIKRTSTLLEMTSFSSSSQSIFSTLLQSSTLLYYNQSIFALRKSQPITNTMSPATIAKNSAVVKGESSIHL